MDSALTVVMATSEPEPDMRATCAVGRLPELIDRFERKGYRLVSTDLRWDGSILSGWSRVKLKLRELGRPRERKEVRDMTLTAVASAVVYP